MDFDEFRRRHLQELLRFARVLAGEPGTAEDIVQEVLIRLFMSPKSDTAKIRQIGPYARRMVVNEYLSWGRKWFRVRPVALVPEPDGTADFQDAYADHEQLRGELARLPRRQRAVLVLRYYASLSDQEIAESLGCSVSTVRSHASRALATLRVMMSDPLTHTPEAPSWRP